MCFDHNGHLPSIIQTPHRVHFNKIAINVQIQGMGRSQIAEYVLILAALKRKKRNCKISRLIAKFYALLFWNCYFILVGYVIHNVWGSIGSI